MNLPTLIKINGKGKIEYVYNALGEKWKKITTDSTVSPVKITTTWYLLNTVYVNDTLQFYTHEDGRIRVTYPQGATPGRFDWDYFVKDHLGNVRMVLTEETKQDIYPAATLESTTYNGGTAVSVEDDFYSVDANNIVNKPSAAADYQNNNGNPPYNNNPYSNTAANSAKMYKLNATTNTVANKIGLGIALKVMAGDTISIFGKSFHQKPGGSGYTSSTNSLSVQNLIDALAGTALISGKGATGSQITGQSGFPNTVAGLVGTQPSQTSSTPKAFINWIILDDQFKYVSGGFDQVGTATGTTGTLKTHDLTTIPWIQIQKNGYIYVYCSNESQYDVFFDNLQVIHNRGHVLEETHYYPFGLTMAGISSKALAFGSPDNKYKYNGIEKENDLGLEVYDAQFRELDGQIGRWWQIDPVTDGYENISPYASMYNNPLRYSDPLGNEGEDCCWEAIKKGLRNALITGSGVVNGVLNSASGGLISSDPFNFRNKLSDDELELYDNSVTVGQYGTLIGPLLGSPSTPTRTPMVEPVGGLPVPVPGSVPLTPPGIVPISNNGEQKKSSNEKLIEEAKQQKAKEQKAQEREQNRQKQSADGKNKQGKSNQDVRGDHNNTKGGGGKAKQNDHENANARRAREQKAADEKKKGN